MLCDFQGLVKKMVLLLLLLVRKLTLRTQLPQSEEAEAAPGRGSLGEELTARTNLTTV